MSKNVTTLPVSPNGRRQLPFKTAPMAAETRIVGNDRVGTVEIKMFGSLLAGEAIEFSQLMADKKRREIMAKAADYTPEALEKAVKDELNQMEFAAAMMEFSAEAATVLIKYRVDDQWTLEDTLNSLPIPLMNDLAQLLSEEMAGSQKRVSNQDESEEKEGDTPNVSETQKS